MKFIGITGGVGAGKSAVLDYLATKPGVHVMLADEIAHELMEPGTDCYEQIRQAFPEHDIYKEDGHFDRIKLAKVIFSDENNARARVNLQNSLSPLSPCHPKASYFRNGNQGLTVQKSETYGSKARDLRCKSQRLTMQKSETYDEKVSSL